MAFDFQQNGPNGSGGFNPFGGQGDQPQQDGGTPKQKSDFKLGPAMKKAAAAVLVVIILFVLASSCWYTVGEMQQAIVITFGKVTGVSDAGLHFKLPYPIQTVYKLDVNKTQKMQIGYTSSQSDPAGTSVIDESKMITGDFNIVNIDFFIEWKISNPAKYVFNSDDPVALLRNFAQSAARGVIGTRGVDGVLTTERSEIQSEIKDQIARMLDTYDIGVAVLDVKIQDSEPPTAEVSAAFKAVETAKQEKETSINQALAYRNSKIPEANSNADKILRQAESFREQRINEAKGEVAKFNQMYEEYAKNKEITRIRMYLETMESILPGIPVYIDSGAGDIQKLLPIRDFVSVNGGSASGGGE